MSRRTFAPALALLAACQVAPDALPSDVFHPDGVAWQTHHAGFDTRIDRGGVQLDLSGHTPLRLELARWGRPGSLVAPPPARVLPGECAGVAAEGACMELDRGPIVEWYAAQPQGLEQGFTLATPPAGAGNLMLELTVTGASASVDADRARLVTPDGTVWALSGLRTYDAAGVDLPSRFEATDDGLRLVVDDAGATYPIVVDPMISTVAVILAGHCSSGLYGVTVTGDFDANGDGYDDVAVGAPDCDSGAWWSAGEVTVNYGSPSGVATTAGTTLLGTSSDALLGWRIAAAGDVNNDGYDDLLVSQVGGSSSTVGERAYIYMGSAAGIGAAPSTTLYGESAYENFGYSLAGAGDVNGDGYDDVLVAATYNYTVYSRVYLYLGSAAGTATTASVTWTAPAYNDGFGYSVASLGDVNGDGYADIGIGARASSKVYVYTGGPGGPSTTPAVTITGAGGNFGADIDGAGDVNNDGYDDIVVGAYSYDASNGRAYVYAGSAAGPSTVAATTLSIGFAAGSFGTAVAGIGDADGDGFDDVIVTAPSLLGTTGKAFLYTGGTGGLTNIATSVLLPSSRAQTLGYSASAAGDTNGDGRTDVIVGATAGVGKAYVYFGLPRFP